MNVKQAICRAIDERKSDIIELGEQIWSNPELGFKEYKTAALVKQVFDSIGLKYRDSLALTGVKAWTHGKKEEINVCIMGEMDAVVCPRHPFSDKNTGAAHSCGHHAQVASMLGAAFGLVLSGAMEQLDGNVCFFAVPAEEYVELEYRERLKQEGKICFFGGKQELIHTGEFDDINMAMMFHAQAGLEQPKVILHGGSMGFVGKTVQFLGKEAHAGGAPHEGVNALNAAIAAIMCIHAQRETFRDEDGIRVHPIITKGGDLVNIVPADVRMETYVRAKNMQAVMDANRKVDRAIMGASYAMGTDVKINNMPGYMPMQQNFQLGELLGRNVSELLGGESILTGIDLAGSSDVGDLSMMMPLIQPLAGGFSGLAHSKDFMVADREAAYIIPAKLMAMTVVDLLSEQARVGKDICSNFKPQIFSKTYNQMWENIIGGR